MKEEEEMRGREERGKRKVSVHVQKRSVCVSNTSSEGVFKTVR